MRYNDLPSPLIYLLSGGIILFLTYLFMIFYMPYSVFSLSKIRGLSSSQREFLIYACSAFVGGIVVVFSNWQEAHFLIMYMLYISIFKIYKLRGNMLNFHNLVTTRFSGQEKNGKEIDCAQKL